MAEKGNPSSYTGRLKDEKKKNERRINDLEEEVRKLQEKLKDHEENCQPKIKKLEEEIERLKEENRKLKKDIQDIKKGNRFLENEMEFIKRRNGDLKKQLKSTKKQLKEHDEKLKEFELSEDELIIRQLCSSVQENILRIVLQKYFNKFENKSTEYIEMYIKWQIKNKEEQKEAKSRWEKLKKEIELDDHDYFITQLQPVKASGNKTAHPSLTEKKIEDAKTNLKKKGKYNENMVQMVDGLKTIWEETNSRLPQNGPRTSTAEGRDQSGQQNPSTYASKAAGGQYIKGKRTPGAHVYRHVPVGVA